MSEIDLLYNDQHTVDESKDAEYISGYVTDTRLMGVLVVYIKWAFKNSNEDSSKDSSDNTTIKKPLHQFFYFDQEEFGLDTFKSIETNDEKLIKETEASLIGGLGANKVPITEKEAAYLVNLFVQHNIHEGIEFPDNISECDFLLTKDSDLSSEELEVLQNKICVKVSTICEAINYFLMRLVGRDEEGAKMVSSGLDISSCFATEKPAALLKNTIDLDSGNIDEFTCTSLIDENATYRIVRSKIKLTDLMVTDFEAINNYEISPQEAANLLARDEFISSYRYDESLDLSQSFSTNLTKGALKNSHKNGQTFLIFNKDNSHVDSAEFRLNSDLLGVYYVSKTGEVLICSNTIDNVYVLEKDLASSSCFSLLKPVSKFQFDSPVLYSYINSEYKQFEDFIESIR